VEETVAGRAAQIKEYTIGVQIYRRGVGFDPKADAIVRVEAARLRGKLKQYYSGPGAEEPVQIILPSGTYVPVFTESGKTGVSAATRKPRGLTSSLHWAAVLSLAGAALGLASWRISRHPDTTFRVTVVPISNLTGDPAQDASAGGLTDQIAARLADEPGVRVERSKSTGASLRGSLQAADGRRRLVAHLDDAAGLQVWSMTLHSGRQAPGEFEEMASALIARTLSRRFGGRPVAESVEPLPRDQAAADLFERGHKEWETQTREGVRNAATLFHEAVRQDPGYAGAWAELGAAALFLVHLDPDQADRWNAEARAALRRALSLDDLNAEAHIRLGNLYLERDWDFTAAERELQFGIELNPGSDSATRWFALAARLRGYPDRARRELQYALLLNPASEVLLAELASLALASGRLAEVRELAVASLAVRENYAPAHFALGLLEERLGDLSAARAQFGACSSQQGWPFDCRASLARLSGAPGVAAFPRHYSRALLTLAAGREQAALAEIRDGLRAREPSIQYVCLDPQFSGLFRSSYAQPCAALQPWIQPQR